MDQTPVTRLNALLAASGLPELDANLGDKFQTYLELLTRWNSQMNLTAIRDEEGILSRHFVECIACARVLPQGVRTLLDFGSGAGFPGIPIALMRPGIAVTLAESQAKKAAFLREVLRILPVPARVFSGRAESIGETFDCVTLRAVDRMEGAIKAASGLVSPGGWLALMAAGRETGEFQRTAGTGFDWESAIDLPNSDTRVVALGCRRNEVLNSGLFHVEH
jgi:16S rRNA (guanine527-N7)-methyltransferase